MVYFDYIQQPAKENRSIQEPAAMIKFDPKKDIVLPSIKLFDAVESTRLSDANLDLAKFMPKYADDVAAIEHDMLPT